MKFDIYCYIELKIKSEEEIPELWDHVIKAVDFSAFDVNVKTIAR